MSTGYGPRIITDNLVLYFDPKNTKSYPGTGSSFSDLINSTNVSLGASTAAPTFNQDGYFNFDGSNDVINGDTSLINRTNGQEITVSCWIKPERTSGQYSVFCTNRANNTILFNWIFYQHTTIGAISFHGSSQYNSSYVPTVNQWINVTNTVTSGGISTLYVDGIPVYVVTNYTYGAGTTLSRLGIGADPGGQEPFQGGIGPMMIYHRALSQSEILVNYMAHKGRFIPNGTIEKPFNSPYQAQSLGYGDGNYYFLDGSMSTPTLLEFKNNYYEGRSWVCVFRSPYNSTETTNKLGLNMPMGGLLVQRDSLDIRGAVYWSSPILYNTISNPGNNTADFGYSPRRILLGFAGGHGIYTTSQGVCGWSNGLGSIGAGWNGSTCGSFPNGLLWGTGQANTATYANASGIWSHWIYWE